MIDDHLKVELNDGLITITLSGTDFLAVYQKPDGCPHQLVAKTPPTGTIEFRARARTLANEIARELGWIV